MNIEKYLYAQNPKNPLDLFPEGVIEQLLDGFCLYVHAGVAILHNPKEEQLEKRSYGEIFDRIETNDVRNSFNTFCRKLRKKHENLCNCFDESIAVDYFDGIQSEPNLYQCHMGLIDMSYPIKLNGHTVAVVFAGQIIKTNSKNNIRDNVVLEINSSSQKELIDLLENNSECDSCTDDRIELIYQKFKKFGLLLQDLLDKFYQQQLDIARREVIEGVSNEFTVTEINSSDDFPKTINPILYDFCLITNIDFMKVYSRKKSRFELLGMNSLEIPENITENNRTFPVKSVASIPSSLFVKLKQNNVSDISINTVVDQKIVFDAVNIPNQDILLYLSKYKGDSNLFLDTLIAFSGDISENDYDFIKNFCDTIAIKLQVFRLVLTLKQERSKFSERVRNAGHTTKDNLQKAVIKMKSIQKELESGNQNNSQYSRKIDSCNRDIKIAKFHMQNIYSMPQIKSKIENFRSILESVIEDLDQIQIENNTSIRLKVADDFNPNIRIHGDIEDAINNIIENAIKYSNPYECIEVVLHEFGIDFFQLDITNFGQGIPNDSIEKVKLGNHRWIANNLSDELKKRRNGTGFGLSMAIDIIENHGGWIDIKSIPKNNKYKEDASDHWETLVSIYLPVN